MKNLSRLEKGTYRPKIMTAVRFAAVPFSSLLLLPHGGGMEAKMALMGKKEIEEIIPHRDPFLLIDEIEELEPGKRVVAKKHLREDETWFKGHFPGHPVQPGVLTIEMLAQAGAVCVLSMPEFKGKIALFAGIDKARFRRPVKPGETLTLEVEILKLRTSIGVGKAVASVNGERAVTAEITFAIGSGE